MSLEQINIGTFANDGTGDDLREAFRKVNLNFIDLDLRDDESTTASNIGTVGEGIFARKNNFELEFKKIAAGTDVTLTSTDDRITINANGGLKRVMVISDSGSHELSDTAQLNVYGGAGISTGISGTTLTVTNTFSSLNKDLTPQLGGNLNANGFAIANATNISATSLTGTVNGNVVDSTQAILVNYQSGKVTGPVDNSVVNTESLELESADGADFKASLQPGNYSADRTHTLPNTSGELALRSDIPSVIENEWAFGTLDNTITSIQEWLYGDPDVDMGSFDDPEQRTIDLGSIIV